MAQYRFDYEIEGVSKTMTAIRRGIREGMEESAADLIGRGEETAKDKIYSSRRVWTKEVYKYGWGERDVDVLSPTRVTGRVTNYSEHAYVVDEGYKPQWGQPPVQNIIDWVDDKVQGGWSLSGDDSGGGDPPKTQLDSQPVAREDATIEEVITGADAGIEKPANSKDIRIVTYSTGDRGFFKPNELSSSPSSSVPGVVQNEEVFSRAAKLVGSGDETGFPLSRQRTITDYDDTVVTGNMMAFVEDAEEIGDRVKNYYNPDAPLTPEEFGEKHVEWAARTGVLDYIVGNDDRHTGNILIDPDGQPWAIDSGGHQRPEMDFDSQRRGRLLVFDEWENMNRESPGHGHVIDDYDKMYAVSNAILDEQEKLFEELRDIETREEFIEFAKELHPDDSLWNGHYERLLGPDSTDLYSLYDNEDEWGGQELWEFDIESLRESVENTYENRQIAENDLSPDDDTGGAVDWNRRSPDTWTTTDASLTDMVDEILGEFDDS